MRREACCSCAQSDPDICFVLLKRRHIFRQHVRERIDNLDIRHIDKSPLQCKHRHLVPPGEVSN